MIFREEHSALPRIGRSPIKEADMHNIFYLIGVIVVILAVLSLAGIA